MWNLKCLIKLLYVASLLPKLIFALLFISSYSTISSAQEHKCISTAKTIKQGLAIRSINKLKDKYRMGKYLECNMNSGVELCITNANTRSGRRSWVEGILNERNFSKLSDLCQKNLNEAVASGDLKKLPTGEFVVSFSTLDLDYIRVRSKNLTYYGNDRTTEASSSECLFGNCQSTSPKDLKIENQAQAVVAATQAAVATEPDKRTSSVSEPAKIAEIFMKQVLIEASRCRGTSKYVQKTTGKSRLCGTATSKGMCFAAIKDALISSNVTENRIGGLYAVQAHKNNVLKNTNKFDLLLPDLVTKNPDKAMDLAPPGAIFVYSGGPKGHGHIEAKVVNKENETLYCSDYCSKSPIENRKLVGIYYPKAKWE